MVKQLVLLLLVLSGLAGAQTTTFNNIDDSLTNWSLCIIGGCGGGSPGGNGVPTSHLQSINNVVPSLDGASMQVSMTAPAASQGTNLLWTKKVGANDAATQVCFDGHFNIPTNKSLVGQFEYDQFIFSQTDNIEYMFGTQCDQVGGKWDVFNQNTLAWVHTSATCNLSSGWHQIAECAHRVAGDTSTCSGKPCMYYDSLTIDGILQVGYPSIQPAGTLPGTFTSNVGFQFQMNILPIGSGGAPVAEYMDEANFSYTIASPLPAPGLSIFAVSKLENWERKLRQ